MHTVVDVVEAHATEYIEPETDIELTCSNTSKD